MTTTVRREQLQGAAPAGVPGAAPGAASGTVLGEARLRSRPQAPGAARRLMRFIAAEWDVPVHVVDDADLCLSELVTNAFQHAADDIGAPMRLVFRRHGTRLRVEVHDTGGRSPVLRYAGEQDESGRGCFIVAQVADEHGCTATADGKAVWFELTAWP